MGPDAPHGVPNAAQGATEVAVTTGHSVTTAPGAPYGAPNAAQGAPEVAVTTVTPAPGAPHGAPNEAYEEPAVRSAIPAAERMRRKRERFKVNRRRLSTSSVGPVETRLLKSPPPGTHDADRASSKDVARWNRVSKQ